ncbi:MAG: MMPL family transporter [Candidatus Nanopelagicales bacterium]|nr:MMPL family transporter [Candidatus Nanopelagicales bacterium]
MSRWAIRHPVIALIAWAAVLIGLVGASAALGTRYNNTFELPGAQSTRAQQLLQELPAASSPNANLKVVWSPSTGLATDAAVQREIEPLLKRIASFEHVECVIGPYERSYGSNCPPPVPANLEAAIVRELTTKLKISSAELRKLIALVPEVYPLAKANSAELGDIAAVLAYLVHADPKQWEAIGRALPGEVAKLHEAADTAAHLIKVYLPAGQAAIDAVSPISKDRTVAYATVNFDDAAPGAFEATHLSNVIQDASTATLTVGASGTALAAAGGAPDSSELVGLLVAIVILLIAFGSIIAAGLPIIVALTGLVGGLLLVGLSSHLLDVASFAPTLAMMIGLGVGIDYALFIMNRYRQGLADLEPKEAAIKAVSTAGRAVLFAGSTVIVALLGMFVLGISFFNGLAVAAASTVLMVMLSALWMLPALLSLLGHRAMSLRMPWARHQREVDLDASRWAHYGALLQRKPLIPAVLSLVVIGILAAPALSLHLGFPDNGTQPPGTPLRNSFELMSKGYGPGVNGPFFVAVELRTPHDLGELSTVVKALEQTPGVASTLPNSKFIVLLKDSTSAFSPDGRITSVLVQPTTDPQSPETAATLERIRTQTAAQVASSATILVGGTQAISTDFTAMLASKLPLFLLLVVGLGFLALMILFHSLVIPLTAALTSLISFAGALGITVAVFQNGTLASLLGVYGTGPILPFLPVMVFAILFGLSMDYQVFLVSRMQEEWHHSGDNRTAVRRGLAGSGRVVVFAATIMTSVFLSFVPTSNPTIKLFGVALASAVIIDAFIVRLVLVPSLMTLFGRANWWLPGWLNKALPKITLD